MRLHLIDRGKRLVLSAGIAGIGEAEIVEGGKCGEDAAALRHITEPEPRAAIGWHLRNVGAVEADRAACRRQEPHDCAQ